METLTFRAVSCDDEVGAALDDALGQIEYQARRAGAVLTSLSHHVLPTPQPSGGNDAVTVSVTAIGARP